jgi:hypothetical protein
MKRKRRPRPPSAPARLEAEEAVMMQHAREALKARRAGPGGDPFAPLSGRLIDAMAAHPEQIAGVQFPSVVELALAGSDSAHKALVDLIAERKARGEPLGPDLTAYADFLAEHGSQLLPRLPFRPHASFAINVAIVLVVIDLTRRFPELRRRRSSSKHASAFSLVAAVLAPFMNIGEEAIRKIWQANGPPRFPSVWPPQKK